MQHETWMAMRHGHETCKIVDWQFSQSQAEKLGQDVTIYIIFHSFLSEHVISFTYFQIVITESIYTLSK